MMEDPEILRMNIQHYQSLLKLELEEPQRQQISRLLAEARDELRSASAPDRTTDVPRH